MANIESNTTLDNIRLLIDTTRKDLSYIQTLVLYGDNNGKSINTKVVEMQKDIQAILEALAKIEHHLNNVDSSSLGYRIAVDKRIKSLERIIWMIIGAAAIGSTIITIAKSLGLF